MVNKPKAIGTAVESATVKYLNVNGFGGAERLALHGNVDEGDIGVCPGVMAETKGGKAAESASDAQVDAWLVETEIERVNRGADVAVLVLKRKGKGAANAGQWFAFLPGWAFCYLAYLAVSAAPEDAVAAEWCVDYDHAPALRVTLADAVTLLRRAGFGDPL